MGRPVVFANINRFPSTPNQWLFPRCPVSARGAYRDRHEREAGCGGRSSVRRETWSQGELNLMSGHWRARRTALKRTAKPCGPDTRGWCQTAGGAFDPTGSVASSSRQRRRPEGIRLRGEHGISRQTTAQGMPECSGCTCMLVSAFLRTFLHTRPRVQQAPGIPCSLRQRGGDKVHASLGRNASRERRRTFSCRHPPCAQLRTGAGDPVFQRRQ